MNDLEVIVAQHAKDAQRQERKLMHLENTIKKKMRKQQMHVQHSHLLTTQEKANLELDIYKKKYAEMKDELWQQKRNTGNMKEWHRGKVEHLTLGMIEWRDSKRSQFVSAKVSKGKHAPFTKAFEYCSRGMFATGVGAEVCVGAFERVTDFSYPRRMPKRNLLFHKRGGSPAFGSLPSTWRGFTQP